MKRRQAFKYALRPNGEQQRKMRQFAGCCRFVFNKALALQKERYAQGEKKLGYVAMAKQLTAWRNGMETPWLKDAPVHPLQQALKDLERAYDNFFAGRAAFPRFRKKGQRDRFRYPDPKQIKLDQGNARIFLPKLGWLRYRNSRQVLGRVRNVTVTRSGDRWFISIQTERDVAPPAHPSRTMVGIDVGTTRFATLSDGTVYAPRNSFKKHQRRLARLQRTLARKQKFSNNWRQARARVRKLHRKIADARRDALHKTSTAISQNHAIVCIEDLQVKNMSASARGSAEHPGRNVKAKARLNRSILDQGWYEFRRQLEYKQQWRGGHVWTVPPRNTSRQCSRCGHVAAENRKTQARFRCVACGHGENADLNAAKNILAAGLAATVCGGTAQQGRPMKQEPTEATQACA